MEEYHQITITEYLTWKQEIKDRLNTTVDNFIVIGYRLKQIRDSEAYRNDGYPSMGAFVQAEYGLNEATASKFIKINDNYSEGGNSMYLQEKYQGYGYNKLYEMIALPESDRALIKADTSVKEIREIKQFNKESEQTPAADADEEKLLKLLLMDNQEAFDWIMSGQETEHMEDILYAFAPSGSRMIRQGTLMLFLQSEQEGIKIKRFGAGQQNMSYEEFFERIRELFTGRESELFPEKEEHAADDQEESEERENDGYCKADRDITGSENRTEETGNEEHNTGNGEAAGGEPAGTITEDRDPAGEMEQGAGTAEPTVVEPDVERQKEGNEVIAPAQTSVKEEPESEQESDESVIEEPENVIETSESVTGFPINVPENTDPDSETEEETATNCHEMEPKQQEKTMTRYEYMQDLTEAGLASYLFHYMPTTIGTVKDMKKWLHQTVDAKGREY